MYTIVLSLLLGSSVSPVPGAVGFCQSNPTDILCSDDGVPRHVDFKKMCSDRLSYEDQLCQAMKFHDQGRAMLFAVNWHVNHTVKYVTDQKQYGVEEKWTYPITGLGDCEDYVLQKRMILLQLGYESSRLNVASCLDPKREGHAVLVIDDSLVLDNITDTVVPLELVNCRWDRISVGGSFLHWRKIQTGQ